ncbi:Chromosome segregation protein SMC [Giardia duodenalis]|uniref:Chromosome segregation protein SMC n=1 Tax=Giardia intestinalis TaxID=5741 RepID=V6TRC0_GIAIN|nr:Chromosome segregation protein SMC [Giardia intestinalis]
MSFTDAFSMNIEPYSSFGHSSIASPFSFAADEYTVGFLMARFLVLFCIPLQEYKYIPLPATVVELRAVYPNHTGEYLCLVEVNEQHQVQLSIYHLLRIERVSTILLSGVASEMVSQDDESIELQLPTSVHFSVTSRVIAVQMPFPTSSLLIINWQRGTTESITLPDNTEFLSLCPFSGTAMISVLSNQTIRLWRSIDGAFKDFTPTKMRASIPTQPVLLPNGTEATVSVRGCFWMGSSLSAAITNLGDVLIFAGPSFIGAIPVTRARAEVSLFKEFKSNEYYTIYGQVTAHCVHNNLLIIGTDLGELVCIEFCLNLEANMRPTSGTQSHAQEQVPSKNPYSMEATVPVDDEVDIDISLPFVSQFKQPSAEAEEETGPLDIMELATLFSKTSCISLGGSQVAVYPHKVLGLSIISNTEISNISCATPEYALIETASSTMHIWPLNFNNVLVIDKTTLSLVQKSISSAFGGCFSKKRKDGLSCTEAVFRPRMAFTDEVERERRSLVDSINEYMSQQSEVAVEKFYELISSELDLEIHSLTLASDDAVIDTAGIQYLITLQGILGILREDAPFSIKRDTLLSLVPSSTTTQPEVQPVKQPSDAGTQSSDVSQRKSGSLEEVSEIQTAIGTLLQGITKKLTDTGAKAAADSTQLLTADVPSSSKDSEECVDNVPLRAIMNDADVDSNSYLNRFTSIQLWSQLLQGFPVPSLPPPSVFQQLCGPRATLAEKSLLRPGARVGPPLPMNFGKLTCMDASSVCDIYIVGSSEGYIYAGRTSTGKLFAYRKFRSAIQGLKLYPNGLFGVAQYNDGLGIFVINDHDILESIFFTESGIRQFALSHGGGYLAASIESDKRQAVRIRSLEGFDIIAELSVSQSPLVHLEFVPGDTMLIIVERDGLVSGYSLFTKQRLFDCKLRGVCLTSAAIAIGRQIPGDVIGQASMYGILNKEEDAVLHDESLVPPAPGKLATTSLQQMRTALTDETQLPYDMLIKHGSVIDSVCYEPIVVLCYDISGRVYEVISNRILHELQSPEPFTVNLLALVPPPVSNEILMSNCYIEKLVKINQTSEIEAAMPVVTTATGAIFGIDQEELIVKGEDAEVISAPIDTKMDYYAHHSTTHEIAETNLENALIDAAGDIEAITAEHLEARLNQSKKDYYMGTITSTSNDSVLPETQGLVDSIIKMSSRLYSQRPVSLSEPECQFVLGFTANGWITAFDWPFRIPKAIYRRRLHGSDITAAKLIRGSTLFTLSADELIISHIRFLIPASSIFSGADKSQHFRMLKSAFQADDGLESLLLKLPITQYLPVMPFDHCSRTVAYGSSLDSKFFNMLVNATDIWVSTDYRASLIKEATRDKAGKITAKLSHMKATIASAIQQLDQQNSGGDQENSKMEVEFDTDHEHALVETQERYQTRIEQIRKDIADLEQMLKNEAERYESSRSSLQKRFESIINYEETMRMATVANLNAQIDQQDQALSKIEAAYNEELRQIDDERREALKAVEQIGETAVEREKNASATLRGWESMQRRRIATIIGQGHQLSAEYDMEVKKAQKYNEELAKVMADIEATRKVLQKKDEQVAFEERKIYDLNKDIKRLGKTQFVLTNQISELKAEIHPRDELISDMRERVDGLSGKLEDLSHQWDTITNTLDAEQAAVKGLTTQIGEETRRLRSRERALENLKKDIIVLVTENNPGEWMARLKALWKKYQAFHDDISKSVRAASKAYDSDSTVANELIEHKGYLNSRIDDLYAELKKGSRNFTTAQAFCLDENSALLTESHRLRDENISLKTQLQRVVAMLEEIRLNELSVQTQRRMRERAASQNRSPSLSEKGRSSSHPTGERLSVEQ